LIGCIPRGRGGKGGCQIGVINERPEVHGARGSIGRERELPPVDVEALHCWVAADRVLEQAGRQLHPGHEIVTVRFILIGDQGRGQRHRQGGVLGLLGFERPQIDGDSRWIIGSFFDRGHG